MSALVVGQQFGDWTILGIDGRRAVCRCRCKEVRVVAADALLSGMSTSCGCAPLSADQIKVLHEARAERQRRRDRDLESNGASVAEAAEVHDYQLREKRARRRAEA
jgi:hypothetical protein